MSYPAVPAEIKRGGNELHDRFWGMETRSPVTPYLTAWRDVAKHTVEDRKLGWPSRILIFAMFGTEPWIPPADLVEEATQHQMRDSAQLRLGWFWSDAEQGYALDELTLQLQRGGRDRPFRSVHRREELDMLDVEVASITRPESDNAVIPFHVSGHLRERNQSGKMLKGNFVRFTAMGSAALQPGWMMY
jgi:hypothetical protein